MLELSETPYTNHVGNPFWRLNPQTGLNGIRPHVRAVEGEKSDDTVAAWLPRPQARLLKLADVVLAGLHAPKDKS